jgi:hypothetical protein
MFRSQAQPCYPESGHPDGCFPDSPRTPSPFSCWIAGGLDRLRPEDLAGREPQPGQRPSRPSGGGAERRRSKRNR